jgi:uncharacterized protein
LTAPRVAPVAAPLDPAGRAVVARLGLQPHPEGGFFRETFRDDGAVEAGGDARGRLTLIYFLVPSTWTAWHAVDAVESWHFYDGAPVVLSIARDRSAVVDVVLGRDLDAGQEPHGVVPAHAWQRARSTGTWSLVGCAVAPAFTFAGFRIAPPGFDPTRSAP